MFYFNMSPIQSLQPLVGLPGPYTREALVDNLFAFLLRSLWNLQTCTQSLHLTTTAVPSLKLGSPHFWDRDSPAEEALLGRSCPAPAAPSLLASPHASSGRAAQHQPPALLLAVCSCTSLCRISPILGIAGGRDHPAPSCWCNGLRFAARHLRVQKFPWGGKGLLQCLELLAGRVPSRQQCAGGTSRD